MSSLGWFVWSVGVSVCENLLKSRKVTIPYSILILVSGPDPEADTLDLKTFSILLINRLLMEIYFEN